MTKPGELLATVVNGRAIDGAEYPIRDIGWTWDLEKVASGVSW
jgi:hypothetical protein